MAHNLYLAAASAVVFAVGCTPGPDCGPGTLVDGQQCTRAPAGSFCAVGTVQLNGSCVPARSCGPGTAAIAGECVALERPTESCEADWIPGEGLCVGLQVVRVKLPYSAGETYSLTQGYNGAFSHNGAANYSFDFSMPEGSTATAVRSGRVVAIRQNVTANCISAGCAANYVIIDHGDNTFAGYWHLRVGGALVGIGDQVCQGQAVAHTGNSGFSTGPHLHLEVWDLWEQSLPLYFTDIPAHHQGVASLGESYTSGNEDPGVCNDTTEFSTCAADLFASRGVRLDAGVPCALVERDRVYVVSGRLVAKEDMVSFGQYHAGTGTWTFSCFPVAADGSFVGSMLWTAARHQNYSKMIWGAAQGNDEGDCQLRGLPANPAVLGAPRLHFPYAGAYPY